MIQNMDALPWVADVYKRDLQIEKYFIGYLLHPYVSLYTGRGCPAQCTFCLWPQTIGGHKYRVSHLSFFQVNRFLVEDLLKTVTAHARGALALDLYSGVGFFALPLARTFAKVVSVDANLAATRDLQANAELAGVTITAHNEHAEEFLKKTQEKPNFVVLDPPRSGLGVEAAGHLAELGAKEIAYLSCDPSTLARDLAVLTGSRRKPKEIIGPSVRYEIAQMHLFDLFPQTFHIETLVRLRRAP